MTELAQIPLAHGLGLAGLLFTIGVTGLLARRNVLFTLMSLEIMLNAAGLAFVVAGAHLGRPDGQAMFVFILAVAAAEVAVGLALILRMRDAWDTLDLDQTSEGGLDG